MIKRILAILMACSVVLFSGCALAKPEEPRGQDRLIGVLVTMEYLDLTDLEGYLGDHAEELLRGGEISLGGLGDYQGRLYGELVPTGFDPHDEEKRIMEYDLTFPVEGYFRVNMYLSASGNWEPGGDTYWRSFGNGGFCDVNPSIKVTDEGTADALSLTIYFCRGEEAEFYANPIYQTSDGQVYVLPSHGGMRCDLLDGGSMIQTLSDSNTYTEGGQSKTDTTEITVEASYHSGVRELTLLRMDEQDQLLDKKTFSLGEIPEEADMGKAAYGILQATYADGTLERTICSRGRKVQPTSLKRALSPCRPISA